jgi:hypothetical protein
MAKLIVPVTAGALDYEANCYVSLAEADAFFRTTLEGLWWLEEAELYRELSLVSATNAIEQLLRGQDGDKYDSVTTATRPRGQPLQFPRAQDRENSTGTLVVPRDIKDGCCLLGLHVLREYQGANGPIDADEARRIGASVTYADGMSTSFGHTGPTTWPAAVEHLVFPYWKRCGETTEGPGTARRWTERWVAV